MSETATCREFFAPYCNGLGLDIGFGGSAIVPHALTFDLLNPYTKMGDDKQILRGTCDELYMFCDGSMDWIYSSHLLEDFTYRKLIEILKEWRRVLKPGGLLLTNCPDQQKFLAHCAKTGQSGNGHHKEADFGLVPFVRKVLGPTGPWELLAHKTNHGPYSWLTVHKKSS